MSKKTKKGIDGRHLLNWQYRDLEADTGQDRLPTSSRPRNRYHSYQPSSFKQSIFRLVLWPLKTISDEKGLQSPDIQIPWRLVAQVWVPETSELCQNCPICLGMLKVPRITECGHIFCYSCILRHLETPSQAVTRCPVCLRNICESDLKSVAPVPNMTTKAGDIVHLNLLSLVSGSIFPSLLDEFSRSEQSRRMRNSSPAAANTDNQVDIPWMQAANALYCRLVVASVGDIHSILDLDRINLLSYRDECLASATTDSSLLAFSNGDVENLPYIDIGLNKLREKEEQFLGMDPSNLWKQGGLSSASGVATPRSKPSQSSRSVEPKSIYFYQIPGGELIFLHPLCIKCLLQARVTVASSSTAPVESSHESSLQEKIEGLDISSLEQETVLKDQSRSVEESIRIDPVSGLPFKVTSTVLEIETLQITADLRQRVPFLAHLSIGTEIKFVEIDMTHLVPVTILTQFKDDFAARERKRCQRRERQRKEEEAETAARMAHEENVRDILRRQEQEQQELMREFQSAPALAAMDNEPAAIVESCTTDTCLPVRNTAKSFSSITKMSGHFPTLSDEKTLTSGDTSSYSANWVRSAGGIKSETQRVERSDSMQSSWRQTQSAKSLTQATTASAVIESTGSNQDSTSKKKAKKGVPLFSNAGSRNYRA